jgi:ABC-type antimicrobial peptide transport system permease subunit
VRALVRRLDPHQPVAGPRRLSEHLEEVTGSERLAALVMGYFSILGLVLVGVGMRGSMQCFVTQQYRAIGVRIALGAGPRRIARSIVGRGLVLSVLGAAIGLAGAAAIHRLAATFIYGALLGVPTRLGLTAAAIVILAAVACVAPAHRAARIDPARLLRVG